MESRENRRDEVKEDNRITQNSTEGEESTSHAVQGDGDHRDTF